MTNAPVIPPSMEMSYIYCPLGPSTRAHTMPGITSVPVRELFPDLQEPIYLYGDDLSIVRQHTVDALANVDMSMIKPNNRVNVLCSEHGFNIMGGFAYAEMLKTVRDVIVDRTGCARVRVTVCPGATRTESVDLLSTFGLLEHFEGRAVCCSPYEDPMPVDTEIGTALVIKDAYDCEWFVHTHYDDPREIYFNRLISRIYKPFSMSYARVEMRSIFHMNFGARSANIIPRLIFQSPQIMPKHAFTIEMSTSPAGLLDVCADNDINKVDHAGAINTLRTYGKLFCLLRSLEDVITVLDSTRWVWYCHAGGVVHGIMLKSHMDLFDLDIVPTVDENLLNPAVKAIVVNYCSRGLWGLLPQHIPTYISDELAALQLGPDVVPYSKTGPNLMETVEMACNEQNTDRLMLFDGTYGAFNVSESMAKHMREKAPAASVEAEKLIVKWCEQRGIDPNEVRF